MKKHFKISRIFLLLFLCIAAGLSVNIFIDRFFVGVTRYTVRSEKIPPVFDGFKIVQLSDIHGRVFKANNYPLIEKVKNEDPDIILITGDIVNNLDDGAAEVFEDILSELEGCAPIYAVTGNHDEWDPAFGEYIGKWEAQYGVLYLEEETVELKKGRYSIFLSGISDPGEWGEKADPIVAESLNKLSKNNGYNILMFHRADMLDGFEDGFYDLIFSGHMHGGQWRLPFGGGLIAPDGTLFPEYSGGIYEPNGKTFIVSRGIGNPQTFPGTGIPVPRIFNMPEIVSVTLKSE